MNFKIKIRISILLCLTLLFYSFQPVRSVGAASIGEPVPTDVSYWGFDENTTSSILNQGYNNILCLWDFENHEYLLVKCPDHMYYVPGGIICIDGDYTGLFDKLDYQNYIRDQIVYSWGREKGYFNLSASQYFTVYRVSSDGSINSSEVPQFNGVVNGTAWNSSKTKYNALRWLYENDLTVYNSCNYALCWATDSIDYAYSGSGNPSIDLYHWATGVLLPQSTHTEMSFTGGSTLNAAASDIPVYTFYPGGFNFSSPVAATPTPTPDPGYNPFLNWTDYDNTNTFSVVWEQNGNYYAFQNLTFAYRDRIWYGNCYGQHQQISGSHIPFPYEYNILGFAHYSTQSKVAIYTVDYSEEDHDYYSTGVFYANESTEINDDVDRCDWGSFLSFRSVVFFQPLDDVRIVATNHRVADGFLVGGGSSGPSPTPSPTSSPTPTPYAPIYVSPTPSLVPSPGVTITPTQGPSETSVKELRGWKGALQRILQSVFVGNTDSIAGYFKDAVSGYEIVQNPFKQITDNIYINGSDQENFDPFENQQVEFIFDVHDKDGNILGGEHTANWRLTILPKTFWVWLKQYSNYFEIVFYSVDACFLGATMKRWLTKQNDEGSETKEGGSS